MFKGASDKQSNLNRTASHSTKPFGSGRIDVLPPGARDKEAEYNDYKERVLTAVRVRESLRESIKEIDRACYKPMSREQYESLRRKRKEIGSKFTKVESDIGKLRVIAQDIGRDAYGAVFRSVAHDILSEQDFQRVDSVVRGLMGRQPVELRELLRCMANAGTAAA